MALKDMTFEKQNRKTPDDFFKSLENCKGFIYNVYKTNTFKKDVALCYKRNLDLNLLEQVIVTLAKNEELQANNHPHPLKGYKKKLNEEIMECHIMPDWLLVWKQNDTELILLLTNTGSHADLFG
jgi:mRNA interferase YafQ